MQIPYSSVFSKDSPDGIKIAFKHRFNPIGTKFNGLDRKTGVLDLSIFNNLTSIDREDLRYIVRLNKLICPPSVSMYDTCFYGSTIDTIVVENMEQQSSLLWGLSFKNFIIKSKNPPKQGTRASYGWNKRKGSRIFVPDESVNLYKTSTSFSDIAEYIHPLSEYHS